MRVCNFNGCEKTVHCKGLCKTHYEQQRCGKELTAIGPKPRKPCGFHGCENVSLAKGLCNAHYKQHRNGDELRPIKIPIQYDPICSFYDCDRSSRTKGLCAAHYWQHWYGREITPIRTVFQYQIICTFDGCNRKRRSNGLCVAHASQRQRGQELTPIRKVRSREEIAKQAARGVRQCIDCLEEFPLNTDNFRRANKNGWTALCKGCARSAHLRRTYGMSNQSWGAMFEKQGRSCAVCRAVEPGGKGHWHTDHDHKCCPGIKTCGKCVRSILCARCNQTIGFIEKHPDIDQALAYVEFHNLKISARKAG